VIQQFTAKTPVDAKGFFRASRDLRVSKNSRRGARRVLDRALATGQERSLASTGALAVTAGTRSARAKRPWGAAVRSGGAERPCGAALQSASSASWRFPVATAVAVARGLRFVTRDDRNIETKIAQTRGTTHTQQRHDECT
jgi:hypothetical protein